ncbi:hypothetical protein DYB36_007023 [Aphanomyces astaci]|uniref:Uncharacterized protein n=1 Tax=Aphanomyces astaci TaxID=112090 RepID=A0A397AGM2_APHAT|nr:hypothetical protein DYB36_007023 [Aphanomyces astaci]
MYVMCPPTVATPKGFTNNIQGDSANVTASFSTTTNTSDGANASAVSSSAHDLTAAEQATGVAILLTLSVVLALVVKADIRRRQLADKAAKVAVPSILTFDATALDNYDNDIAVIIAPPFVIAISTNVSGRVGNNLTAPYGTSNTTVLPPLMSQATTASPTATTSTPTTVSPPATPVTAAPEATTAETTTVAPSPIRLATATKTPTPTPTLNNGSTEPGHLFAFAWCVGMVVATASVA